MRVLLLSLVATIFAGCATPPDKIVQRATTLTAAAPIYPKVAKRYGIEGTARVRFCVLADGGVEQVQVEESSGSTHLDAAAVDAVKRSKFRPAQTASGKSVDSCATAPYRFVLEKAPEPAQASWADRVRLTVRKNIIVAEPIAGNPLTEVDVWLASDGYILSRVLAKGSGTPAWDAAVLSALDRTERLPVDDNGKIPSRLRLVFQPNP
jgi:TonB family protein